ncbi:MAG: hypothetical protein M1511_11360 [Deltaproteobacteria bacterium]|nr:hypothetical protein [Deltaproteobacteria bacterium]
MAHTRIRPYPTPIGGVAGVPAGDFEMVVCCHFEPIDRQPEIASHLPQALFSEMKSSRKRKLYMSGAGDRWLEFSRQDLPMVVCSTDILREFKNISHSMNWSTPGRGFAT